MNAAIEAITSFAAAVISSSLASEVVGDQRSARQTCVVGDPRERRPPIPRLAITSIVAAMICLRRAAVAGSFRCPYLNE